MFFQLLLIAIVWEDHVFPLGVLLEDHVGVQHSAQLPQEVEGVVLQVLWGDEDHHHQCAICQLLWHVVCAVQTIPLALKIVAALVAVTIREVIFAVLVVQRAGCRKKQGRRKN